MFNDALNTIRDSQSDLEKTISIYTSGISGRPLVDIIENAKDITVITDLPGFKKENIKIDIGETTLEINAEFQEEKLQEGSTYVKRERKYDEIQRLIDLPARIKIDSAKAEFENGILKVTLPKQEQEEKYQVTVD